VKLIHGTLRFGDAVHLNESKAFGTLRVFIGNDLDVGYGTHPRKQLGEIRLSGIVREVTNVKTGGSNFHHLRLAGLAWLTRLSGLSRGTLTRLARWLVTLRPLLALVALVATMGERFHRLGSKTKESLDLAQKARRLARFALDVEVVVAGATA
jgi:hypothetical protein